MRRLRHELPRRGDIGEPRSWVRCRDHRGLDLRFEAGLFLLKSSAFVLYPSSELKYKRLTSILMNDP
jgi:hypothetical protein